MFLDVSVVSVLPRGCVGKGQCSRTGGLRTDDLDEDAFAPPAVELTVKDLFPGAKVQRALDGYGLSLQVVELPDSTRTAADAAAAIGTTVAQIAKSLIFRTLETDRPVLVIASGVNRVDEKLVSGLVGEMIGKADAEFVRTATGFVIGGVPPVGHDQPIETFVDEDLLRYAEIWAAAGTPNAVFRLGKEDLEALFMGKFYCISG